MPYCIVGGQNPTSITAFYCYDIDPFLMHSSDKVLLNPYTQSKVLSIESYQTYVVTTSWLKTMAEATINGIQTQPNIDEQGLDSRSFNKSQWLSGQTYKKNCHFHQIPTIILFFKFGIQIVEAMARPFENRTIFYTYLQNSTEFQMFLDLLGLHSDLHCNCWQFLSRSSKRVRRLSSSKDLISRQRTSMTEDFSNVKIMKRQCSRQLKQMTFYF